MSPDRPSLGPRGWHSRLYLPHFDAGAIPQAITFRLADSFPAELLLRWRDELELLPKQEALVERRRRIETYLDTGVGEAWLRNPQIASMVEEAVLFFDGARYALHAWVIMPTHGHLLLTPHAEESLSSILHSLKSYTSQQANRILGRQGPFWHPDYFDRYIRNQEHYQDEVAYIENNPMKAGLCARPEDWPWSSARRRLEQP